MTERITDVAATAIEEVIRKSSVGIVCGSGSELWRGVGTGTLIRWRGQHLILTADHVISETHSGDLRFFLPGETPPISVDREVLLHSPGIRSRMLRPFSELDIGRTLRDPQLDLAAITVPASIEGKFAPATFFDLDEEGLSPDAGLASLTMGFPHDLSRVTTENERVVFTLIDWAPIQPNRTGLENFDPRVHFLTSFSPPDDDPDADPRGLSGGARWARRGSTPGVWHSNLDLVGVTVTYYPPQRLLKMVRRQVVIEFLKTI